MRNLCFALRLRTRRRANEPPRDTQSTRIPLRLAEALLAYRAVPVSGLVALWLSSK